MPPHKTEFSREDREEIATFDRVPQRGYWVWDIQTGIHRWSSESCRILGDSEAIQHARDRIHQIARTGAAILLTGETGTGKSLFARAVHEASDRSDTIFIRMKCGGLTPAQIENSLFGCRRNAAPDSSAGGRSPLESADGGTLYLDEIGEWPLELQGKLLKLIRDGESEGPGYALPIKVNLRILASTNRDLEEEVRKGRFRMDLFYRLNLYLIEVPPLRQRKGDIPLLARYFVDKFSGDHARKITGIPSEVMTALESYPWPGNVRELMNIIERAVLTGRGPQLELADQLNRRQTHAAQNETSIEEDADLKGLSEVEREHILRTLQKTGWRIEGNLGAARILGMNPSTMRARMKKLAIHRPGTG